LLLRFHPERRRTGAATFVGRGTAAAVVVIIMRRRNEKRRSVKIIERERKEKRSSSSSRSLTNKQTNKWTHRPLECFEGKEVLGETNAFCLSISHLREEVTEEEEGKESHLLGNPNPSGSSLFEPLFPPFFAIALIVIICVVFFSLVVRCFLCFWGQRCLTVTVL
jgi:hypothetical protein